MVNHRFTMDKGFLRIKFRNKNILVVEADEILILEENYILLLNGKIVGEFLRNDVREIM